MESAQQFELIKVGFQALGVALAGGISLLLGWRLLRRQERVKREEELLAAMRKIRVDALVATLEALGKYRNLADRRLQFATEAHLFPAGTVEAIAEAEMKALEELIDLAAAKDFLLGPLGNHISACLQGIGTASTALEASAAAMRLHRELERWIPPLEALDGLPAGPAHAPLLTHSAQPGAAAEGQK